jgi:hypothetical protein
VTASHDAILDADTLRRQLLAVQQCVTRDRLDKLTRLLWRTYDTPANATALAQLRARIETQRAILDRNDPR